MAKILAIKESPKILTPFESRHSFLLRNFRIGYQQKKVSKRDEKS
jgi:hypothetical protein